MLSELGARCPGARRSPTVTLRSRWFPGWRRRCSRLTRRSRGINYGSNKIRFISPVPAGSRIRLRQRIVNAEEVPGNGVRVTSEMTVEVEGQERPALVAELIGIRYA